MSQVCEICEKEVSKYCCPKCERRTCSLKCVKDHKNKYECDGLKGIPTAPEAADGPEKYTEALFMKDYNFLENVSSYTDQLERERISLKEERSVAIDEGKRKRILEFKKIQKVGKLAELRLLPSEFSRSKKNQTHLVDLVGVANGTENRCEEEPERKSSRRGKVSWTLDFVEYDNCRLIETVFDISDDTLIKDLISKNVEKVYLKNETRSKDVEKWKEIKETDRTLAQVLNGAHVFEYPILAIVYEAEPEQDKQ